LFEALNLLQNWQKNRMCVCVCVCVCVCEREREREREGGEKGGKENEKGNKEM
jgi:hypothetical protein